MSGGGVLVLKWEPAPLHLYSTRMIPMQGVELLALVA